MSATIVDKKLVYDCGCSFDIIDTNHPIKINFKADIDHIPLNCPLTWQLIGDGNTKGVFQLETRLGQQSAKKLKPENIEQLAALSSIMRPGCLQAKRDGKSVTDHYIDRKNGVEEVTLFHPALQPILGPTYGEMIYQEQAMQIAQVFAGFNLQEADVLRKAIGKKKADVMAKVKIDFLNGCKKVGIINESDAAELFGWIEKSQRYSFNKSHAVSYAINGYLTAYCKAHFPVSFFTSYLFYAKDAQKKFDEIKLLVANAKMMDVDVLPPDFRNDNAHFQRIQNKNDFNPYSGKIYFGFADIKDIGVASVDALKLAMFQAESALGKTRDKWNWAEFLLFFSQAKHVKSTAVVAFIESGALDYMSVGRQKMLFDYEQISKFSERELVWMRQNAASATTFEQILDLCLAPYKSVMEAIRAGGYKGVKKLGMCSDKRQVEKLVEISKLVKNPPHSLVDDPDWISKIEETRLGTSLTATPIDACKNTYQANATCMDFIKNNCRRNGILIACQIDSYKTHIVQTSGEEMAFVEISDGEGNIDTVIFPEAWKNIKRKNICFVGNTVMVMGERSSKKDGFIVKDMYQLT